MTPLDSATLEARGNTPADVFFAMMEAGTLGHGIGKASNGRVHGFGPLVGHVALLAAFARLINAQRIVELGTGTGVGTRAFMEACRHTGGHVWSVDKDPLHIVKELGADPRVTFVVDLTTRYAKKWDGPVDIVYVDADHSAKSALEDLEAWAVHSPRLFLMDDTMDSNAHFKSPLHAAETFCERHGWTQWNIPLGTGLCVLLPNRAP
jgi:predicted O-methyltransferase YrrM